MLKVLLELVCTHGPIQVCSDCAEPPDSVLGELTWHPRLISQMHCGPLDAQHAFVEHLLSVKFEGVDADLMVNVVEAIGLCRRFATCFGPTFEDCVR